jgi:hypothetical protein
MQDKLEGCQGFQGSSVAVRRCAMEALALAIFTHINADDSPLLALPTLVQPDRKSTHLTFADAIRPKLT